MTAKPSDRHLDTPSEARRDNHINFVAREHGDKDPAMDETGKLYENKERRGCEEEKDPRECHDQDVPGKQ